MKVFERPLHALQSLLAEAGIEALAVNYPVNRKRLARLGLQAVAVDMLVYEYNVCRTMPVRCRIVSSSGGVRVGVPSRVGEAVCEYTVSSRCEGRPVATWRTLQDMLPNPPLPAIAIDMSYVGIHAPEELSSLRVQLAVSLNVMREWLWDPHLVLAGYSPEGVESMLEGLVGKHKMTISGYPPGRVLWAMRAEKLIILRPDAPYRLKLDELLEADAFLMGGIVDRIPRPGLSARLDSKAPWGMPRRIELRGSLVGVPHRLNRIVEIILRARYEFKDLEKAIIASMTRRDRVMRLMVELSKSAIGGRVPLESIEELREWLPFDCTDLRIAASKAKVEVPQDVCDNSEDSGGR